jgi:hypothetical protein
MGLLTRTFVPYHVRHPARSAVHNADRRRRASNRRANKGFMESVMAWGEPQRRVINADTVARQFEDWYNGLPGRELEVGSTTVEPDPPNHVRPSVGSGR